MKDYDYHRPAEKVLLDSYRKQNRNKNRLLFLAVALWYAPRQEDNKK